MQWTPALGKVYYRADLGFTDAEEGLQISKIETFTTTEERLELVAVAWPDGSVHIHETKYLIIRPT